MHRFCKVVTSALELFLEQNRLYMHRFCKVVTSAAHIAAHAETNVYAYIL